MINQQEWQRWLETLGIQDWLQGRYPAPETPEFPEFQGLTGEQESALFSMMRRGVQGQTNRTLQKVRTSAAQRGAYRSGQLPRLEADVMKAGDQQYSDMLLKYVVGKAGRMQNWNMARAQYRLNTWQPLFQAWQGAMAGAGDWMGKVVQ